MAESWSIEEEKQLQALMAKKVVAQSGAKGGVMSDGSKRRYVDEESVGSLDNPWIEVGDKEHLKVDYQCGAGFPSRHLQPGAMGSHGDRFWQIRRCQYHLP